MLAHKCFLMSLTSVFKRSTLQLTWGFSFCFQSQKGSRGRLNLALMQRELWAVSTSFNFSIGSLLMQPSPEGQASNDNPNTIKYCFKSGYLEARTPKLIDISDISMNQLEKLEAAKTAYLALLGPSWLGLTGHYWALLGLTGPYWALLRLTGPLTGSFIAFA